VDLMTHFTIGDQAVKDFFNGKNTKKPFRQTTFFMSSIEKDV
jgi:hypothetical protein